MRTQEQAFQDAYDSGAMLAHGLGKPVECRQAAPYYGSKIPGCLTVWSVVRPNLQLFMQPQYEWRVAPPEQPKKPVVEWIKMSDRQPTHREHVLLFNGQVAYTSHFWPEAVNSHSHWSPLPYAPTADIDTECVSIRFQ